MEIKCPECGRTIPNVNREDTFIRCKCGHRIGEDEINKAIDNRITNVEMNNGDNKEGLSIKDEHLDNLVSDLDELSTKKESLKSQIENNTTEFDERIGELRDKIEELKEQVKKLKEKKKDRIGEMRGEIEDIDERQKQMVVDFYKGIKAEREFKQRIHKSIEESKVKDEGMSIRELGKVFGRYLEEESIDYRDVCDKIGEPTSRNSYLSNLKNGKLDPTSELQQRIVRKIKDLLREEGYLNGTES